MQYSAVERNKKPIGSLEIPDDFSKYYLDKRDRQMRFCNARDPIYHVFDRIDNRPFHEIFEVFVKESIKDSKKLLKKLVA